MPILDVEIILRPGESLPVDLANRIADQIGFLYSEPPGRTWVKLHPLPPENYAENGIPKGTFYPVFVTILLADLPPVEEIQIEVVSLTEVIAQCCQRPNENVHILYLPKAAGRASFGGRILTDE
jgi:phenylpyruvate tautomerase PptA (4-oxalocrotonate tautomerase family)